MEPTSDYAARRICQRYRTRKFRLLRSLVLCQTAIGGRDARYHRSRHRLSGNRPSGEYLGDSISPGKKPEGGRVITRQLRASMKVYPAIDILHAQAVRLRHGRAEDLTVYGKPL